MKKICKRIYKKGVYDGLHTCALSIVRRVCVGNVLHETHEKYEAVESRIHRYGFRAVCCAWHHRVSQRGLLRLEFSKSAPNGKRQSLYVLLDTVDLAFAKACERAFPSFDLTFDGRYVFLLGARVRLQHRDPL